MGDRRARVSALVALAAALMLVGVSSAAGFGFVTKWGRHGAKAGQFNHTESVATDRAGNVYVTDAHSRVQKFTGRGAFLAQWGSYGSGKGQFAGPPTGIAIDGHGYVYVVDADNNRVEKFTSRGKFVTQWRTLDTGSGHRPGGIAVDGVGNVYVAAYKWIEKFTSKGAFLTRWRNSGPGGLHYNAPMDGIAISATGNLYVGGGAHVAEFTTTAGFVRAWGEGVGGPGVNVCTVTCFPPVASGASGSFSPGGPSGIAVGPAGHVFVSDVRFNWVQEFTPEGAYVGQFGGFGSGNGRFRSPHDVAADSRGNLYVADTGNHRIQKFGGS